MQLGDVISFHGWDWQSALISLASLGVPYFGASHLAIAGPGGLWWEATAYPTVCARTGKLSTGVVATAPEVRLQAYRGRVKLWRLCRPLYSHEQRRLAAYLELLLGVPYDKTGAMLAGGMGGAGVGRERLRLTDARRLFCSELVARAHQWAGICTGRNFAASSPNRLLRLERRRGVLQPARRLK